VNREPKISEIQKLINHFRDTNREHELLEVLDKHNIKSEDPIPIIDPETHEFHEEALAVSRISEKQGLRVHHHRPFGKVMDELSGKWYYRYTLYYFLIFLGLLLLLNAPIIIGRFQTGDISKSRVISVQGLEETKVEKSAPLDPGEVIPVQSQLLVPKLGITAPIVYSQSAAEKDIQSQLTQGVVHYAGTAMPGEVGNSFITGHSSNFWWIKGSYNYVFINLDKLAVGDQAKIYYEGNKYVYAVTGVRTVEPSDTSVLAQGDTPTLTLMTCTPPGTNWKRLVVSLNQISPKYEKPKMVTRQYVDNAKSLPSTDSNSTGGVLLAIWTFIKKIFGFES
jgi:LPXTG-site transpeptidase (sortase) family protein